MRAGDLQKMNCWPRNWWESAGANGAEGFPQPNRVCWQSKFISQLKEI